MPTFIRRPPDSLAFCSRQTGCVCARYQCDLRGGERELDDGEFPPKPNACGG